MGPEAPLELCAAVPRRQAAPTPAASPAPPGSPPRANARPHPVTGHAKQASSFPHWTRQRSKSTCRHNSSQRQLPHTRPQPILDTAMAAPACRLVVHRCACLLAPPPSPLLSLSELALHTFFFSACRKSPFPSPSFLLSFFLIATAQMPAFVYHLWEAGDLTVCIPLLP